MTFPKINMASYWVFVIGGVIMLASFFVPGGAAKSGWTAYTPLSVIADKGPAYHWFWNGQNLWLIGFVFLITSSLLGRGQFHHDDHPAAGEGAHLDAAPIFRLGAVHHRRFCFCSHFRRWKQPRSCS
jgi:heme/copper-type cytochrome/quinol oxidase subunit 1